MVKETHGGKALDSLRWLRMVVESGDDQLYFANCSVGRGDTCVAETDADDVDRRPVHVYVIA